jgi:hypothetical protein
MTEPIKILYVSANPHGTSPLQLNVEYREIDEKIRASRYRDALKLIPVLEARWSDIIGALLREQPQIVHFSGHGSRDRGLYFIDDQGNASPMGKDPLVELIETLKDNIRVVVLNACHSHELCQAIVDVVDCAIGMDAAIEDPLAIKFASAFYLALGYGRSVHDAFRLGTVATGGKSLPLDRLIRFDQRDLKGVEQPSPEAASERPIPRLYFRAGVDPAKLFLIDSKTRWEQPIPDGKILRALIFVAIVVIAVTIYLHPPRPPRIPPVDREFPIKPVSLESELTAFNNEVTTVSDLVDRTIAKSRKGVDDLKYEQLQLDPGLALTADRRREVARRFHRMFEDYISILNDFESVCLEPSSLIETRKNLETMREKFSEERIESGTFDNASQLLPRVGELFGAWSQLNDVPAHVKELCTKVVDKWVEAKRLCNEFSNAAKEKNKEILRQKHKSLVDSLGRSDSFRNLRQIAQEVVAFAESVTKPER